jgi:tyrosyl-tRNA synthetase
MTFLEFNYMLMQATDFLELERKYACQLQLGGSDQWGNILNGVELIRRVDQKQAFGLTTPLLATASGQKMGKTISGAVWLNADKMAPYEFWQWWRNVADADVGKFMKMFTELPVDECDRLGALGGAEINGAKIVLANAVTGLLHGDEAAAAAEARRCPSRARAPSWDLRRAPFGVTQRRTAGANALRAAPSPRRRRWQPHEPAEPRSALPQLRLG